MKRIPGRAYRILFRGIIAPGLFLVIIGEIFFRLPVIPRHVTYVFDPVLGKRLAPSQTGSMWIGNMASLSPPMSFDSRGFRNPEPGAGEPTILCLGSSETMGTGVRDSEVWTALLSDSLSREGGALIRALNGGNPGYGPFHCSVILERALKERLPRLVIARVSMGDRNFHRPSPHQVESYRRNMERNARIKAVTLFLPFLVDKATAQWAAIRQVFAFGTGDKVYARENETREGADRMFVREAPWFDKMASLCRAAGVPLLFVIIDPMGTEAGAELRDRFEARYAAPGDAHVLLVDNSAFGLDQDDREERRGAFLKAYTLVVDPHANPRQHAVIARSIAGYVGAKRLLAPEPPEAPEAPAGGTGEEAP